MAAAQTGKPSKTVALNNGTHMPLVGLGCMETGMAFDPSQSERIVNTIVNAIKSGYRLLDNSKLYGTEAVVGEAVRTCGIPRSELIVVDKLWSDEHHDVQGAFDRQLAALGLDYMDCYLMHWPMALGPEGKHLGKTQSPTFIETWKSMEKLVGPKCKSIGVSNFTEKTLTALLEDPEVKIKPVVNQIEVHIQNPNLKLVPWCQERGIQVQAWGPIAGGPKSRYPGASGEKVFGHPLLKSLATKYSTSVGAVLISWLAARNIVAIPHSASPQRLSENLHIVPLTVDEVNAISKLGGEENSELGRLRLIDHVAFVWDDNKIMGWTREEVGWEDTHGKWIV